MTVTLEAATMLRASPKPALSGSQGKREASQPHQVGRPPPLGGEGGGRAARCFVLKLEDLDSNVYEGADCMQHAGVKFLSSDISLWLPKLETFWFVSKGQRANGNLRTG